MTNEATVSAFQSSTAQPGIRKIQFSDLIDVLMKGLDDFNAKPSHIVLLVVIYPLLALIAARIAAGYDMLPLVFPLLSGFALIGPVAALGLYELSRRRELGLDIGWEHALRVVYAPSIRAILALSLILGAIYFAWLFSALAIHWLIFGSLVPTSIEDFILQILTTPKGWTLIIVGCGVGFIFAVVVLAISAVSFPMLLDRNVGVMTAIQTSVRVFLANPATMLMWGAIVAGSLVLGSLPLFVGLAVVMPVLGHATWHLYRKAVAT
ncbi:MAG TPA: DUF2189 domain-containing protein [Aestuariivirgaceae bacterium]|nr:DUF2189 domain-containing protein [Aestuariivirgaceae bacterium]